MQKCTLALGCFWKPEENFKSKPGIIQTEVGYAGGRSNKVTYEEVCTGNTGHAEVVRLTFDEKKNSFTNILDYSNEKGLYSSLLLFVIFLMLHFIPNIAITVRRLHDTGKSGWWYLLSLIPYIGPFILFILLVLDSSEEENQWIVNPKSID